MSLPEPHLTSSWDLSPTQITSSAIARNPFVCKIQIPSQLMGASYLSSEFNEVVLYRCLEANYSKVYLGSTRTA